MGRSVEGGTRVVEGAYDEVEHALHGIEGVDSRRLLRGRFGRVLLGHGEGGGECGDEWGIIVVLVKGTGEVEVQRRTWIIDGRLLLGARVLARRVSCCKAASARLRKQAPVTADVRHHDEGCWLLESSPVYQSC